MISHTAFIGTLSLSLISAFIHASPLQPRDRPSRNLVTRAVPDYTSKGCYTEATRGRALTGNAYFDSLMTVEKCAAACSKFSLFGVEYGRECYCGDSLNEGSVSAPEDSCSFNCPGNPDEKCGAGNRLNVYEQLATAPVVTIPTPSTYKAEGCFTEATRGRALSGKTYYDDAMTTAKCASACAGFDLFGLEYYRECYCGNKLQPGSVSAPSNECYHPCTGDKNEICGGDNRLNLYTLGSGTTLTPPVSTPKGYAFDGCFTEATRGRALTGSVYYDNAMTVEKCSAVCKGFTLFGVEYGRECYCGNTLQAGSEKTLESQCNFPCPGNDAEFCGAGNRLDVYHFGAATTTTTTSSGSVSTDSLTTMSSSAVPSSSTTTSTLNATSTEVSTESSATSTESLNTSTGSLMTSIEAPTSTEVSVTSIDSSSTSSEAPTSSEASMTGTETSVASTEVSVTSTETSKTSIEVSVTSSESTVTSSEIPTSTEASLTSTEASLTSTEASLTSTEASLTSTEVSVTIIKTSASIETSTSSTETAVTSTETIALSSFTTPTSTATSSVSIDTTSSLTPSSTSLTDTSLTSTANTATSSVSISSTSSLTPSSTSLTDTSLTSTANTATSSVPIDSKSLLTLSSTSPMDTSSSTLPTLILSTPSLISSSILSTPIPTTTSSSTVPTSTSSILSSSSTTSSNSFPTTTSSSTLPTSTLSSLSSSSTPSSNSVSSTISSTSSTITPTLSRTSSTTSRTTTSTSSTSSICRPSPTQVVINPSFDQDLDGSGKYTEPWSFTGIGANSVQSNKNNAYQSYDGDHFAVLYGRSQSNATLSQTIKNLVSGKIYTLQYFYNVEAASAQSLCTFSAEIRGQIVDTFTSPSARSGRYITRSVTYQNTATTPAVLSFALTCPRFVGTAMNNFALDAITLVTDRNGCS